MLRAILLIAMAAAVAASAQTVSFTAGKADNNYLPALTENGAPVNSNWYTDYIYDCALTTNVCDGDLFQYQPGQLVQIVLPTNPTHPPYELGLNCAGVVQSPPLPPAGSRTQPPTSLVVSDIACTDFAFGDKWSGVVTYVYQYVREFRGRGYGYYPVAVSGYGSVTHD